MTFRELVEKTERVYYVEDTLWMAYGDGSGQTIQLPDLKKYLNSDNTDKEHFDSSINTLKKYAKNEKLLKSKGNSKLYEINSYPFTSSYNGTFDIWGGKVKPIGKIYMLITEEKSTIVNFFEKKNEAMNWMKSLS